MNDTSSAPSPMSETTPRLESAQRSEQLRQHVTARVLALQGGYLGTGGPIGEAEATRALALMRQALGTARGADPRTWSVVLADLPEALMGPPRASIAEPTRAESAAMTALTTYAVHQQGQRQPMHRPGVGLGEATRLVAQQRARPDAPGGLDDPTVQRLHRVSMAHTPQQRGDALRALVALMRSAERPVPLDYGQLATDLYWLQVPASATRVHLAWARGLHARRRPQTEDETQPTTDPQHTDQPGDPS